MPSSPSDALRDCRRVRADPAADGRCAAPAGGDVSWLVHVCGAQDPWTYACVPMIVDMRSSYREDLDDFAHDVITMCDRVRDVMAQASEALLRGSLQPAEEALSMQDGLDEARGLCEQRAVDLLALESPRAGDLRQVISSMHIVHSLDRMGALAIHIADAARRRHPCLLYTSPSPRD